MGVRAGSDCSAGSEDDGEGGYGVAGEAMSGRVQRKAAYKFVNIAYVSSTARRQLGKLP